MQTKCVGGNRHIIFNNISGISSTRDNSCLRTLRSLVAFLAIVALGRAAPVEATVALGRKALLNDGVATAWKLSQQALADAPDSSAAHEFRGEVEFRRGDFAQAESEFRAALKLDANFSLARWGLARIAECSSLHKTAAQYYGRAYELNPKDPRIFRDWAMRLHGRQHIDALEKYAAMADPERNAAALEDLRRHIQLDRALNDRRILRLASPYQKTEIPLTPLISEATHMRTYGLDVSLNGITLKLLLDTGASGILIPRRAADRARVGRLADAIFGGFGDDLKSRAVITESPNVCASVASNFTMP
jgi:tetratricopeptide (TPR) repeat protein